MSGLPTNCVLLPCQSKIDQTDRGMKHVAWLQSKFPNVNLHVIDLTSTFETFKGQVDGLYGNPLAYANAKSRLRMVALYQIATVTGGLVVGTGNKVEDYALFFYTKGGDGMVDIAPIGDLYKSEVREMCRQLGVLPELSEAVPTDGLWDDARTDEGQLGGTYDEFEWAMKFIARNSVLTLNEFLELTPRKQEVLKLYNKWHNAGLHKSKPIPTFVRNGLN
jgi:NAD+ synthase